MLSNSSLEAVAIAFIIIWQYYDDKRSYDSQRRDAVLLWFLRHHRSGRNEIEEMYSVLNVRKVIDRNTNKSAREIIAELCDEILFKQQDWKQLSRGLHNLRATAVTKAPEDWFAKTVSMPIIYVRWRKLGINHVRFVDSR